MSQVSVHSDERSELGSVELGRVELDEPEIIEPEIVEPFIPRFEIDDDGELENVPLSSNLKAVNPSSLIGLEVLRCIVCKLLPYTALCQCRNNHTICAGCYQQIVNKPFCIHSNICPRCNTRMLPHKNRNLIGERDLAEMIVECEKCGEHLPRKRLRLHETRLCTKRLIFCKYKRVDSNWKGVVGQKLNEHEQSCELVSKKGVDLMDYLCEVDEQRQTRQTELRQIMKILQMPLKST